MSRRRPAAICIALATAVGIVACSPRSQAQEIMLTGPLPDAVVPMRRQPLPFALRGELLCGAAGGADATTGHDVSIAGGFGGAFRFRPTSWMAFEIDGGLMRGVQDASERRWPVALRTLLIVPVDESSWELFAALGPSYERVSSDRGRRGFLGGELGVGFEYRVDPRFNRFVMELVLTERHGLDEGWAWATGALLRIGIATSFGRL